MMSFRVFASGQNDAGAMSPPICLAGLLSSLYEMREWQGLWPLTQGNRQFVTFMVRVVFN